MPPLPQLRSKETKSPCINTRDIFLTGTCWGSYLVMKLCHIYRSLFLAGVSFHPATGNIAQALGENEREIYFGVKGGGLPQVAKESNKLRHFLN